MNNNTSYRPSVVVVNAAVSFIAKRDGTLYTIAKEDVTGSVDQNKALELLKSTPNWKEGFVANNDYANDKTIFLATNPARDGVGIGESRASDAGRVGRALATLVASLEYRATKQIDKTALISLEWDGDAPRLPFDDDGKPFCFYRVEEREKGEVSAFKFIKVDGKFPKTDSKITRDETALLLPLNGKMVMLEYHVMADLLEQGFTFMLPGSFLGKVREQFYMRVNLLRGNRDAYYARKNELAAKAAAYAREHALKSGELVIE